jgi:hypothetical protein
MASRCVNVPVIWAESLLISLAHGRRGVELAVEHDGERPSAAGLLALLGDLAGDLGEAGRPFAGEAEDDLGLAVLSGSANALATHLAGHLGDALDEIVPRCRSRPPRPSPVSSDLIS